MLRWGLHAEIELRKQPSPCRSVLDRFGGTERAGDTKREISADEVGSRREPEPRIWTDRLRYFDSGAMRVSSSRTNSVRSGGATSETAQNWKPPRDHFMM